MSGVSASKTPGLVAKPMAIPVRASFTRRMRGTNAVALVRSGSEGGSVIAVGESASRGGSRIKKMLAVVEDDQEAPPTHLLGKISKGLRGRPGEAGVALGGDGLDGGDGFAGRGPRAGLGQYAVQAARDRQFLLRKVGVARG